MSDTSEIKTALLVDGHSMLYRSYHTAKKKYETDESMIKDETLSIFKFTFSKLVNEKKYHYKIIAFDVSRKTFRREKFPDYKKHRAGMPQELKDLKPRIVDLLSKMNVTIINAPESFEADDVLATLSKQFTDCEIRSVVCTADKDLLQLVNYFTTVHLVKKYLESLEYTYDNFSKLHNGFMPSEIPLLKALAGDVSDNYKGIPGIGEKTAQNLVKTFSTKENMYKCLDQIPPKIRAKLIDHEKDLDMFLEIATVVRNLKLNFSINDQFPDK